MTILAFAAGFAACWFGKDKIVAFYAAAKTKIVG